LFQFVDGKIAARRFEVLCNGVCDAAVLTFFIMRTLMLQRLCSSYASGLATAEKLLAGRSLDDEELELELGDESLKPHL
jgi:hypothetical protein